MALYPHHSLPNPSPLSKSTMSSLSLPPFYLSAPTTPGGRSPPQTLRFYSSTSSPLHHVGNKITDVEFEFGSSRRLADGWLPSSSTISFADELFCNGQVLPLKPPPRPRRLQRSVPTSPRSLSSRIRNPFAQKSTWNDNFDPFMIALEKVSEEAGGRMSVHRRSRSYSPARAPTMSDWHQEQPARAPTMIKNQTPTARTMMKRLWVGRRVMRDSSHEPLTPLKNPSDSKGCTQSKMQKMKSFLLKYASLKKETMKTNERTEIMKISRISYFKRLKTNTRKKESIESKMKKTFKIS